jgi:hypothetical protein
MGNSSLPICLFTCAKYSRSAIDSSKNPKKTIKIGILKIVRQFLCAANLNGKARNSRGIPIKVKVIDRSNLIPSMRADKH